MSENAFQRCQVCGQSLPAAADLNGLCAACLARLALGQAGELADVAGLQTGAAETLEPEDTVTMRFGDYDLLEEIGRGGMGVVYRARQRSLDRDVALKMIPFGALAGADSLRRFRAEAEAAAHLQHSHIVAIHEVGEHDGQHFFSMELVPGGTLADRLRQGPMAPREAAGLLEVVARAVNYAHQQGILHRDLKPANILLDSTGQPHVTDFGLAKRMDRDANLTMSGQILGSPNYMPPEQAAGARAAPGPASDIYSLGAVLYHALTGRPPFQTERMEALLDQLFNQEPVSPRLLNPGVPRDLETVCLKCLEKEPARRYASGAELADDLGRWLRDEPVHARPITRLQRAAKWARRRPAVAALSGSLVLVLLAIAIGSPIAALRFRKERNLAALNFLAARQAVATYLSRVTENPKLGTADFQSLRRGLLETAVPFLEELARRRPQDPRLREETIWALDKLVELRFRMGDAPQAILLEQQLIQIAAADLPKSTDRARDLLALSGYHVRLARSLVAAGQLEAAEGAAQAGIGLAEKMRHEFPGNLKTFEALANTHLGIGLARLHGGEMPKAEQAVREGLRWLQLWAAQAPGEEQVPRRIAEAYDALGLALKGSGKYADAEPVYREGVAVMEKLVSEGARTPEHRKSLAYLTMNLGVVLNRLGKFSEAEATQRRSLALNEALAAEFPSTPDYQLDVARGLANLSTVLQRDRPAQAEAALAQAIRRVEPLVAQHPDLPSYRKTLGTLLWELADSQTESNKLTEAEQTCQHAIEVLSQLVTEFPRTAEHRMQLARTYNIMSRILLSANRIPEGERALRESLQQFESLTAAFPRTLEYEAGLASAAYDLADALANQGRAAEARVLAERALDVQRALVEANPQAADYRNDLPAVVLLWLNTVRQTKDHAVLCAHVEDYLHALPEPARDGEAYEAAAELTAAGMTLAEADEALPAFQRAELVKRYSAQTLALLRLALERGVKASDKLAEKPAFAPLRNEPAFSELLARPPAAQIEASTKP